MTSRKFSTLVVGYVWIYCLVMSSIIYLIFFEFIMPKSFILGTVTSLFCFSLTTKNIIKLENNSSINIKKYLFGTYQVIWIKFILYAAVLYISSIRDDFNLYLVFAGLFSVKLMVILCAFVKRGELNSA